MPWQIVAIVAALVITSSTTPSTFSGPGFLTDRPVYKAQLHFKEIAPFRKAVVSKKMSDQERWAYIVTGESGGQWQEGSLLVAWTLRSWQINRGMPASAAGRRWGWNGWRSPTQEALNAVRAVWNQPLSSSPFEFMREGKWCQALGSAADKRYWQRIGWWDEPNFTINFGNGTDYQMNCYW